MILMKTVLVLSMIGIQLAASTDVAHHQDAEEVEYLKQLVKRLTLRQNTILKGLIQSVEKQSSKIKGAKEDVIQRIKYEVLQDAIEQEESLRELGLDDVDIEGIQWVTAKLTGATTEEDAIAKVLKGMSNQDLKALKKNIDGKLLHGVLEEIDDDGLDIENEVNDRSKVLSILEDLDGMINQVYDEDIEHVMDEMSDTELKVVLKNVEDQELGELVTAMNDQDFNKVMRNLKGDTEEISMARDIVKIIQSEELDDLTHQKLEQHVKELSQSRKRRDLNDVLGENIEKNRQKRETEEGFQGFSSSEVLSTTIAGHQKLMANIVGKEKKSRERKRSKADILEKQKNHLRWQESEEIYKEPTYLAPNFGIEDLATGDRQKRHLPGLDWLFSPDTTINSLIGHEAEPDTNSEPYFNQDFLNPFTLLRSEPDTNSEPYIDQDYLNLFTKFHSEPDYNPEYQTTYSKPKITQQTQWTYYEPKPTHYKPQATYEPQPEPEPEPEPSYHTVSVEPDVYELVSPISTTTAGDTYVEYQSNFSPEYEYEYEYEEPQTTCDGLDSTCEPQLNSPPQITIEEPQLTCDESDPACNKPQSDFPPETTYEEPQTSCDGLDSTCAPQLNSPPQITIEEPQPTCDESDPACSQPQSNFPPETTDEEPQTTCDGLDSTCAPQLNSPPQITIEEPQSTCDESDPACSQPQSNFPPETTYEEPQTTCDGLDSECAPQLNSPPQITNVEPRPTCDASDPACNEHQSTCKESDPTCLESKPTCDGSDPTCLESQPNSPPEDTHGDHDEHYHHHTAISLGSDVYELVSPISTTTDADTSAEYKSNFLPETTDEEPQTTCDGLDSTCAPQLNSPPQITVEEPQPICDESDPACNKHQSNFPPETTNEESQPNSPPEDTHGDQDEHRHFRTFSLGSDVYEIVSPISTATAADTSAETSKLTNKNAPHEKLSLSNGAPKKKTIYLGGHSKPLKNSHMDTLKSVKLSHELEGLPLQTEEYSVPTCDESDPACNKPQSNFPPETTDEELPEDTHGDQDENRLFTSISLGSDVYEIVSPISTATAADTSAETSKLTNKNAPYEQLTLSNGAPKRKTIYLGGHSKPLKNSHMDTLKSVKLIHELEGLPLQTEKYSVPQAARKNNAPNEKLTLSNRSPNNPTIPLRQHSKPLNSDTLKSVKTHDAAPILTSFSFTFKEKGDQ